MKPETAAIVDDQVPTENLTLDALLRPVADELTRTRTLYHETVLQTAERNYIHRLLQGEDGDFIPAEYRVDTVDKIAQHLLQSNGKWIRAALVLLTADCCGVQGLPVRQIAVAVELVHLATLIHDDIIDQATVRRGIESVPSGWGNSVSVLMGDFLYSKSFKLLLASKSIPSQSYLTKATGQMCLGEIKQLRHSCYNGMTERDYLEMIENKTASLMAAATASGAHLGGLPDDLVETMHEYGYAVGMAFQIADDILDYTSSTSILGKEQGGDLRNGKVTLPLIHLMQNDGKTVHSILKEQVSLEKKTHQLVELMQSMGSIDYAYSVGMRYGRLAKDSLKQIESKTGSSASLNSLYNLVDFVLLRKR